MSTTRSHKRRIDRQDSAENVGEIITSPVLAENIEPSHQVVLIAGPSSAKSPTIENSVLEELRASLKEEIISEMSSLLAEFQKELLKLLKSKSN